MVHDVVVPMNFSGLQTDLGTNRSTAVIVEFCGSRAPPSAPSQIYVGIVFCGLSLFPREAGTLRGPSLHQINKHTK